MNARVEHGEPTGEAAGAEWHVFENRGTGTRERGEIDGRREVGREEGQRGNKYEQLTW